MVDNDVTINGEVQADGVENAIDLQVNEDGAIVINLEANHIKPEEVTHVVLGEEPRFYLP